MEWIQHLANFIKTPRKPGASLALGAFDGLHLGHMAVLQAAATPPYAQNWGVFTFSNRPFGKRMLLTAQDRKAILQATGAAFVVAPEFEEVRDLPAEDFAEQVLFGACGAKRLCCGEDFRFGKNAAGDISLLQKLCAEHDAELLVVPPVLDGTDKISSTRIRGAVERGEIPLANRLLGRAFSYRLPVIHGNHLGRGLGTPTFNQAMPEQLVLPPFGVYASFAQIDGDWHFGVTNIGVKPTVGSDRVLSETWLPEFSGDLYGKEIKVALLAFLRPERKFPSLDALRAEIQKNAKEAKEIALQTEMGMLK